jgi:hypothetical protein
VHLVYRIQEIYILVGGRKSVAKRALQVVSATYKQLYEAITDPFNGYSNPETTIVNKTPQQVDLLLQL